MPVVKHSCGNCGNDLGQESIPTFGVADTETKHVEDPDCNDCNPFYDDSCCGVRDIDPAGICRRCKNA